MSSERATGSVVIEFEAGLREVGEGDDWPLSVALTNGKTYGCDFVVSATGVEPAVRTFAPERFVRGSDGGLLVDEHHRASRSGETTAAHSGAVTVRQHTEVTSQRSVSQDLGEGAGDGPLDGSVS